jgi:3-(3-hydroxy-phenyl)propionate hydroxylase
VVQGRSAPALLESYQAERHEAALTNVQVTNRTARFLRPQDGIERVFRDATIALAKKHLFARSLVNTGRMAVANPYGNSPLTAPDVAQSHSVQNVGFAWADGSAGKLTELLQWAQGLPLLLIWANGTAPWPASLLRSLQALARAGQVRCVCVQVQVPVQPAPTMARETILDTPQRLWQACGFGSVPAGQHMAWAIVRSDSYLAARGLAADSQQLTTALTRLHSTGEQP